MDAKNERLAAALAAIRKRWGLQSIRPLSQTTPTPLPHLPTGFTALDEALGSGGLPRGRITEIVGIPTSGMTTIGLHIVAQAQKAAPVTAYIDVPGTLDPDYALRCGVDLARLLIVRPHNPYQALSVTHDLLVPQEAGRGAAVDTLLFHTDPSFLQQARLMQALGRMLDRTVAPLGHTESVLLFLTPLAPNSPPDLTGYPAGATLPHYASVRLLIYRERWLYRRETIRGYEAQVLVVKNKVGPEGARIRLQLSLTPEHHP